MSDIFISYSSKDKEKADQLSELLASAGLSVWIDKKSIELSTNWSGEIAEAIEQCRAFIILLSTNSAVSVNVAKEVSLASHYKKKILPLDLEPVTLSRDLAYHLSGLHRAPMTNIDVIIRAIGKLGLEATQAPVLKLIKETDGRKSLMILPFQDLSPTADNGWFADGLVAELISALSNVKALRVSDAQSTKEFKNYKGPLAPYAHEMSIRYFIEGSVRKFGDQIKISTALLDIETGDYLWQDSMKGTMEDIFDIQEKVAEKVVGGLNIILTKKEKSKLDECGTENAEAYELFLKANEYFGRQTKEGFQLAIQLFTEAIRLDPRYASALSGKAKALTYLYRSYIRDPTLLDEGRHLITEAFRLKPDLWNAYHSLSLIHLFQGKLEEAEQSANEYIFNAPEDFYSHFTLAFFYSNTGLYDKAIAPYQQVLKLKPENLAVLWNIAVSCNGAKEQEKSRHWSEIAIPIYERHLKLFPDDDNNRVKYALFLHWADRDDEAKEALRGLENLSDGVTLYNAACLHCMLEDYEAGLKTFRKVIENGYRNINKLKEFLIEDDGGIGKLKGTPQWEEVKRMVEGLSQP